MFQSFLEVRHASSRTRALMKKKFNFEKGINDIVYIQSIFCIDFLLEVTYPSDYLYAKDRFMLDYIKQSFSRRLTVYLQLNNPSSQDLQILRGKCKSAQMNFHFAKPALCKQYFEEKIPGFGPIGNLMLGKVGLLSSDAEPELWRPVLASIKENPFLWVICAQFEGILLQPEALIDVCDNHPNIHQARSQLVSLLNSVPSRLVSTISHPSHNLCNVLSRRTAT